MTAFLFVRRAEHDFAERNSARGTIEATHISQLFFDSIWASARQTDADATLDRIMDPAKMAVFSRQSTFGLGVVSLTFMHRAGRVLWSSSPHVPGQFNLDSEVFDMLVTQAPASSELRRGQSVVDMTDDERSLDVVRTLLPIRVAAPDSAQEGTVVGVLQIDQDVTADLAAARGDTLRFAVLASAGTGAVLFALLLLIVFRADRIITQATRWLLRQQEELEATQAQNIQSAKLAAVGELVSGVAHELNNPLSSILGLARSVKDRGLDLDTSAEISMLHDEAERSIQIVRDLLAFARPSDEGKTDISLNEAVEAALALHRHQLEVGNISLDVRLQPDLPRTRANARVIQQVVLNLVINAEQAMLEAHGMGRLLVQTERAGPVVQLVVSDNGPGIAAESLDRVFEPFFTTKETGKGTGLGLSICYGIIQKHAGTMRVESEPTYGATFLIELPVVSAVTAGRQQEREEDQEPRKQAVASRRANPDS